MTEYKIQHITPNDLPRVARYLGLRTGGVYSEADWQRILQWIWIDNPNRTHEDILGWMIVDAGNNIAGVLGNIAANCIVRGEMVRSYWATSWFVDEAARGQSLQMFMLYIKQRGLLMSNTPNPSVETMLVKAFKYQRADSPWFRGSFVLPLHPVKDLFATPGGKRKLLMRIALAGTVSLMKVPQAVVFLKHRTHKLSRQISVDAVDIFSGETDEWFKTFSAQHDCVMLRNAQMYNWIARHPENKNAFQAFAVRYDDRLQGYMIFKTKYNARAALHYIELVDEALLPLPAGVMKRVVAKVYYRVNQAPGAATALLMRSNSEEGRTALRNLFGFSVKKVEKTYFKQSFANPVAHPLLTSLDGDSIFF